MTELLHVLTGLGESVLLLPVAGLLAVWLAMVYSLPLALRFSAALAACAGLLVGSKLVLLSCASRWEADVVSPSGHAGLSTFVYGTLGLVALRALPGWLGRLVALACGVLAAAIGWSRIKLGAHNAEEVVVGIGVALLCLATLLRVIQPKALPAAALAGLVMPVLLAVVVLQGLHADVEGRLRAMVASGWVRQTVCPPPGREAILGLLQQEMHPRFKAQAQPGLAP